MEAEADTTSAVQVKNLDRQVVFDGTPLDHTNLILRERKAGGREADEEKLHRLEAIRRLLTTVEAIHAVSWLWPADLLSIADSGADNAKPNKKTSTAETPLTLALPIRGRGARGRGVALASLFRFVDLCWVLDAIS